MENYSERDVLEMFNTNEKNVIAWFLSLNPLPICQLFKIFRGKNGHVTYHVTYQHNIYTLC